jgi:CMP-N,N'-diacetyllegionaminic acid synthase
MIGGKRILAIIPARGGSKRLPGKNILDLAGKPLIAWTIDAALKSKYIDRVIVSTDNDEIADISQKYGADVPFMRPDNLAQDESKSIDTAIFVLDRLRKMGEHYEYLIFLQPTSPLRTYMDIDSVVHLHRNNNYKATISVSKGAHKKPLLIDNYLKTKIDPDKKYLYYLNGAIYFSDVDTLIRGRTFFPRSGANIYLMSKENSADIDTESDFKKALLALKLKEH